MKKRVLYANANCEEIVSKNGYFMLKIIWKGIL